MKYSKEDFNSIWKDTTKEGILNQFYYEHIELIDLKQRINKALEITNKILMNNADNRMIAKDEEIEYFDWLDEEMLKQEKILKEDEE